ncbi:hypothetical protein JT358_00115 [Micrococcales bacterium 31B]|nr:hypothetical protein [Micrococcales bacterium 31B]
MPAPSRPRWRRPYSLSEKWLHHNGFPAFVDGYARPSHWARRGVPLLLGAVGWYVTLNLTLSAFLFLAVIDRYATLLEQGLIVEHEGRLNVEVFTQLIYLVPIPAWVSVVVIAASIALSILAVGRMLLFSLRWFVRIAYKEQGRFVAILPLLLIAVFFFFLAAETWQSVGRLPAANFTLALLLFGGLILGFVIRRARFSTDAAGHFGSLHELGAALPTLRERRRTSGVRFGLQVRAWLAMRRTNVAQGQAYQFERLRPEMLRHEELTWIERFNVRVVAVMGRVLVALLVTVVVTIFFTVFGYLAITPETASAWLGSEPTVITQATVLGSTFTIYSEGVRVAVFLGLFSALYFLVSASADKDLSEALDDETEAHVRSALALRAYERERGYERGRARP